MQVTIDIPQNIEEFLREGEGDLVRTVIEALAVEGYRTAKLSLGQVAEMLGLSGYETDGFLKARGVNPQYGRDDVERERADLLRSQA